MKYHDNIKRRRKELKITQTELANAVGYSSKSTISKLEAGGIDLSQSMLASIAKALDTTPTALLYGNGSPNSEHLTENNNEPLPPNCFPIEKKKFPLLGNIACGEPIFADEDFEGYVEAGADIDADFCLRASGDSMIGARIHDGDIVFIKQQSTVNNGQIAAVLIENEATLKRFYYDQASDTVQLMAENPSYAPIVKMKSDLEDIRILGRAIAFQSIIK